MSEKNQPESENVLTEVHKEENEKQVNKEENNKEQIHREPNIMEFQDDPDDKPVYKVVFFARYGTRPRPSDEEITTLFTKYGVVDHVVTPEGRNYAFIFMTSLNTEAPYRKTRATISQIIRDMTPETRFHINVASTSNRDRWGPRRYDNYRHPRNDNRETEFKKFFREDLSGASREERKAYIENIREEARIRREQAELRREEMREQMRLRREEIEARRSKNNTTKAAAE